MFQFFQIFHIASRASIHLLNRHLMYFFASNLKIHIQYQSLPIFYFIKTITIEKQYYDRHVRTT